MILNPTIYKAQIKWFWIAPDGTQHRNNQGFIHNAWEAKCCCGWESKTGGGIKSYVNELVQNHKVAEHKYKWISGRRTDKDIQR